MMNTIQMRTRSQAVVSIDFDAASAAWRENKRPLRDGTFEYVAKKYIKKKTTYTVSTDKTAVGVRT